VSTRLWAVALVALIATGTAAPGAAGGEQAPGPTVRVASPTTSFSPNGDGRRDRAHVRFSLDRTATVSVVVKRDGHVVLGPERLGELGAGRHSWTWDGTRTSGRPVSDGTFSVVLRASRGGQHDRAVVTTYVDRVADRGRLVTTRPTVYPKASEVSDSVAVTYLREGWNAEEAASQFDGSFAPRPALDVALTVVDGSGGVVWRRTWVPAYSWRTDSPLTFAFAWHARGPGGEPVREGTYAARVRVRDAAGNVSRFSSPVAVSYQQLRAETWTSTMPAASATRFVPAGCPGCHEGCTPVPSDRFAGGLSFRACPGHASDARAWFSAAPPVTASPSDAFRITATGGPATPGTTDVGSLSGYATLGPGDGSVRTPWLSPGLVDPPYLPDQQAAATWGFSTSGGDGFDVASFTVEYRYWVPVT
jgi:hypothetical protein